MKIVFATPIYPPEIGGPATYSKKLEEGLTARGHAVRVVSYQGLRICPQPFRIGLYFLRLLKASFGCDAVYAFNLISCGLPACLVSKILRKKFYIRLGGDFLWERAVESGRTRKPLREYYREKKNLKEKFWIWLMKLVFSQTDKIIFTSRFQQDIYLDCFGLAAVKTIIIGNPFPDIRGIQDDLPIEKYRILYAGRLLKLKNIDVLIKAFGQAVQQTDKNLTLKIIGEGPEADHLEIGGKITLVSPLPQQELLREIKQSYLCVLPSLTEITPNFALECLKLQKPILLTRETGYFETFENDLIFIDPQNANDLAQKIIYLLDENNYSGYIEKMKKVSTQRSWDDVVKDHEESFIFRGH